MKRLTQEERGRMMLEAPINRVIPQLAVPTIISMLVSAIYNMADTFFVSQISTSASGAVGIIFSAMAIIQAVSFMIGMGSGNNMARLLGAGDETQAEKYAATGFFTGIGVGLVITVLGVTHVDWVVRFLGATDTIAPHARDYASYIFFAAPFMMCSFIMNNMLRFQGMASYGMVGITVGGILNIILDPILIFGMNLGTAGAAIATAFSQLVSFVVLLIMCNRRPDAISIRLSNFRPTLKMYARILYTGLPSLGRQGIASVSTILLNKTVGVYGDAAIAAMSIVSRCAMFINSVVIGFGQGFQPVCGFSFGARNYDRVKRAFWFCVKVTSVGLVIFCAVFFAFSGHVIELFRREDQQVIAIGTLALRAQLLSMPLWGFITMSNMFTQSIGYGVRATLISIARQGLFLIPALLVLPPLMGLLGIQLAQPIADVLTFVFSLVLVLGILKELDKLGADLC